MALESKHSLFKSFKFAFDGLKVGVMKGRNFRIQIILGIIASILAAYLNFSAVEWSILAVTMAMVIILELVNTAIESIVDIVSPEIKNEAKIAKDVAAASVLIAAVASILIGVFLFLPKLL